MTINENIERIQGAKDDLKASIEAKGVTVPASAKIDDYADLVDEISGGGGSGLDFSVIGYTSAENTAANAELEAKIAYSKTKYDAWDPTRTTTLGLYQNDKQLVYAPHINTSAVTTMQSMFSGCTSLTTVPELDTSKVKTMNQMFSYCSSLTTIPELETSAVTNMATMFNRCTSLTTIPQLDTSSVREMNNMFYGCTSLTTIPQLNTSAVTTMQSMFTSCSSLTTIPEMETSAVTSMSSIFESCTSLTTIPQLDTSSVASMSRMFFSCSALVSLPELDCSSVTDMTRFFGSVTINNLTDLGGFPNLKCNWNDNYGLAKCPNLTVQSLLNVLDGLYDFTGAGETPTSEQGQLKLGSDNYNKLTAEQIAIGTAKGWTITA